MGKYRIPKDSNHGTYYLTLTLRHWYHVLDRYNRWDILAEALEYYKINRKIEIYAYVFMINHIHIIVSGNNISECVRDFKRYTANKIVLNITKFEPSILKLFQVDGKHQFWKKGNQPKYIYSDKFLLQKINYIHNNPVVKDYVAKPEHWLWSSASEHSPIKIDSYC